jgi:hypothetical protein
MQWMNLHLCFLFEFVAVITISFIHKPTSVLSHKELSHAKVLWDYTTITLIHSQWDNNYLLFMQCLSHDYHITFSWSTPEGFERARLRDWRFSFWLLAPINCFIAANVRLLAGFSSVSEFNSEEDKRPSTPDQLPKLHSTHKITKLSTKLNFQLDEAVKHNPI